MKAASYDYVTLLFSQCSRCHAILNGLQVKTREEIKFGRAEEGMDEHPSFANQKNAVVLESCMLAGCLQ